MPSSCVVAWLLGTFGCLPCFISCVDRLIPSCCVFLYFTSLFACFCLYLLVPDACFALLFPCCFSFFLLACFFGFVVFCFPELLCHIPRRCEKNTCSQREIVFGSGRIKIPFGAVKIPFRSGKFKNPFRCEKIFLAEARKIPAEAEKIPRKRKKYQVEAEKNPEAGKILFRSGKNPQPVLDLLELWAVGVFPDRVQTKQ